MLLTRCVEATLIGARLALKCAPLLLTARASPPHTKTDASPVTVVDFAVQIVVARALRSDFPDVPLVAEEDLATFDALSEEARLEIARIVNETKTSGEDLRTTMGAARGTVPRKGPYFVLDPIDGTKGFIRGDQYAICLGYVDEDNEPIISVLACPNLGEGGTLYAARLGESAECLRPLFPRDSSRRVRIDLRLLGGASANVDDAEPFVGIQSFEKSHYASSRHASEFARFAIRDKILCMDSQVKFGMLAEGKADVYPRVAESHEHLLWDVLPSYALVCETGGAMVDLKTGERLNMREVLCRDATTNTIGTNALLTLSARAARFYFSPHSSSSSSSSSS